MVDENNIKTPQPRVVWELVDENECVVSSLVQTIEEYEINGAADALACLLPLEMIESANRGEWHPEGLIFDYGEHVYTVRCRQVEERELSPDPIPEPLSLGCGVSIDAVSDRMDSPTWYIGVYLQNGEWVGEVPVRRDPRDLPPNAIAEPVARYILRVYPECTVGVDELARRIRGVLRTAREGAPRSYPEIERGVE